MFPQQSRFARCSSSMAPYEVAKVLLLLLRLVGTMPSPAAGNCSPCLNGGTCEKSHTGKGFRCVCPNEGLTDYGLRCEILTRSYEIDSSSIWKYVWTKHDISTHPFEPDKLAITFELSASCTSGPTCDSLVLKGEEQKRLVTFGHRLLPSLLSRDEDRWNLEFFLWSPAVNDHKEESSAMTIDYEHSDQHKRVVGDNMTRRWISALIHMSKSDSETLTTYLQICRFETGECKSTSLNQTYNGDLRTNFQAATLSLGKMKGCIRFVRVNGVPVDLGDVRGYESNAREGQAHPTHQTSVFCQASHFSCRNLDGTYRKNDCGKHSICQAETPVFIAEPNNGFWCSCKCSTAKRRRHESITNNEPCNFDASNECSHDVPVIVTGSNDYEVTWTTNLNRSILLGSRFFTIEGSFRTGETQADRMLFLDSPMPFILPTIAILRGFLSVCLRSCFNFPELFVSDHEWHSFSVTIMDRALTAMLDLQTTVHFLPSADVYASPFSQTSAKATPVLSIPNSCVRGLRLSGIYLPIGGSDITADDRTRFIKVSTGRGAAASPDCNLPNPALTDTVDVCACGVGMLCNNASSGNSECSCSPGYKRTWNDLCINSTGLPTESIGKCNCRMSEACDTSSGRSQCKCTPGYGPDGKGRCTWGTGIVGTTCRCRMDEVCDKSSGRPECRCADGYERDSRDQCILSIEQVVPIDRDKAAAQTGTAAALVLVVLLLHALIVPAMFGTDMD